MTSAVQSQRRNCLVFDKSFFPCRIAMTELLAKRHRTFVKSTVCVTLLSLMTAVGCQTPGSNKGFRLPGTPHLPSTSSVPTPKVSVGGKGSAVPGIKSASMDPVPGVSVDSQPVAQVGFVDRPRLVEQLRGNDCQACSPAMVGDGCLSGDCGGSCAACASVAMPMVAMPMGHGFDPQEYLCNGGDVPPQARLQQDDSVIGVASQDAIVHYTADSGAVDVQASNRVCLYSPRFGSIRQVSGAASGEKSVGLNTASMPVGPTGINLNVPSLMVGDVHELAHANTARRVDAMRDRNRGVPVAGIVQPLVAEDVLRVLANLDAISLTTLNESQIALLQKGALAAQTWMVRDAVEVAIESMRPPELSRVAAVEGFTEYNFPDAGRLQIIKVADRQDAQQGEEVHFAIHVRNVGDSKVNQVEVIDSLVTRLEYVADSQKCDRKASFDTMPNDAGSTRMTWTLQEPIPVGETALIEFTCRVR